LREYAVTHGEDPSWVASLFQGEKGKLRPIILHANGHATHLHVRFYNPVAQQTARLAHSALAARGLVRAATVFELHRAKRGETLGMLARKYGTTVREIQLANGLRSSRIQAERAYRIPKRGKLEPTGPVVIPPRRLPSA
jgi:penicillin-insensitive murein endopeptidase